ncbi:glucose 1-dehydrogenase [Govanella unica]|uniref:Glucose 1-dehydrogenase n=1 Tax=Govanella unica TaxID=2975056 RepID=A0A9X3TV70_9PROT|nr:glucose 1-dehydrogenase [Govania unica]MDA5192636.1 glucose 1-dehydrogenase [Govania unica]
MTSGDKAQQGGFQPSVGRVAGKVALVTGAASGIGRATAELLLREGARVVLSDIEGAAVTALAATYGDRALGVGHDVTRAEDWQLVLAATEDRFGGLHILVNNAGIVITGTVEETSLEDWHKLHAVDLDSVFLGCKYAIPLMAASSGGEAGGGSIVNISSVSGIVAGHNLAAYNSAKAAVRHLSKSVALHCARAGYGIRSNSVHPSFVMTAILDDLARDKPQAEVHARLVRQIPLGRLGRPEEIAAAIVFLASEESSFMTGAELVIDGGISAM